MRMDFPDVSVKMTCNLMQYVRLQVTETSLQAFQGLARRKNKFPVGGVMVMLLVPLLVLVE
jgi:hypothetical protein